jgi:LCP family protein required for cell wall assembly
MRVLPSLMLGIVLLAVVGTVGAAALTYTTVRQMVADSPVDPPALPQAPLNNNTQPTAVPLIAATPTTVATTSAAGTEAVSAQMTPTAPRLDDPTRVTILLLGIDQRQGEKGPFLTDTMMVLSIDPVRKTSAMLSIPRDIYLTIPMTNQAGRINTANVIGEQINYPGGGPALAARTVQSLIGAPIQHYVLINFDVFTTVINALGTVQVCPTDPIHDDQYPDGSYGYITVDFKPGCQELDAVHLLQYARVRHNAGDDFGRSKRQQEVIRAVREKVLSLGGVSALLGQAPVIWNAIKDNIKTDLTFDEILQLAQFAQTIPKDNIHSAVITDRDGYLLPSTLPSGEQVFSPVYEKIHELIVTLFDAGIGGSSPASAESAAIVVSNGAGVDGLAGRTADTLKAKGFNVISAQNADAPGGYGKTVIRVFTNKMQTARLLAETLGIDATAITLEQNGPPGVDIELVVGKDLAPTQ